VAFTYYYDDIAVSDSEWINPKIYRLDPNDQTAGTGITANWTGVPDDGATTEYQNCDEIPNDGNTTYIKGNTAYSGTPHSSSWHVEDASGTIPADAEIEGVKITGICYDPGTGGLDSHGKLWVYVNGTQDSPMTGYSNFPETYYGSKSLFYALEPVGSLAWTLSDIDSLIVGVETQDNNADANMPRVTWLGAQVCTNEEETPIYIRRSLVMGNTISECSGGLAIKTPNDATAPDGWDQLTIVGNIFRENTLLGGVLLTRDSDTDIAGGKKSTIAGNVCFGNLYGIHLQGGHDSHETTEFVDYVSIFANICADDQHGDAVQEIGIYLDNRVENCPVIGNVCQGNTTDQIDNSADDPLANDIAHNIDRDD